jgi:peptidoglycan-N-acetylglucosamine deacetylase
MKGLILILSLFCYMFYFVKTPVWLQKLFPKMIWKIKTNEKKIYLSFDDGPHYEHTFFVLNELKKYKAKATFFCIGNNVRLYPEIYKQIIDDGHSIGNHSYHHLNGKKTKDDVYIKDVEHAAKYIDSNLFRPPFGQIKKFQAKVFREMTKPYKIIMWTVLSGDFDTTITKEKCLKNVLCKTTNGSIVVFHDSEKASAKMKFALPKVLEIFTEKGYSFEKLT